MCASSVLLPAAIYHLAAQGGFELLLPLLHLLSLMINRGFEISLLAFGFAERLGAYISSIVYGYRQHGKAALHAGVRTPADS